MEETDAQLQLKKRARRRLVGAIAFVTGVAVVLPMIMDHEPKQATQDVEIRIPGQDEKPFAPKFATAPAEKPAVDARPAEKPVEAPKPPVAEARPAEPVAKAVDKPVEKAPEKPATKPADRTPEKTVEKPVAKPTDAEAKRAAAILGGQGDAPAAKGGEQVILIGAFANEGNVKQLKSKLSELGIKVYTEPLDSPQGRKTRVRAGPFANREAADKALEKMKRIGVSGVVTARQ